ncbi:hypothetical protein Tco_1038694 [Tanacetum coccineum]
MRQRYPDQLALLANQYNPLPSYNSSRLIYDPPVVEQQHALSTQLDSGFVVPSFLPTDDPIASLNKAMLVLSTAMNLKFSPTNNQLRTSSNLRTQATIQDGKSLAIGMKVTNTVSEVNANQSRAQEVGVILHEDQQDFLVDRLEEMDDCDDLQLHTTSNFKADHVDAYDSDCDDEATTYAIFMASLSPARSINRDTVGPYYDSELLSKVLSNMLSSFKNDFEALTKESSAKQDKYIEELMDLEKVKKKLENIIDQTSKVLQ